MPGLNSQVTPNVLLLPGKNHHAYVQGVSGQKIYSWRMASVDPHSPVTVDELMKALGPAISRETNKKTLETLLQASSEQVSADDRRRGADGTEKVQLVTVKGEDDKTYDLSPSDVQTMVTLLRAVHDLGLDYKFVSMGLNGRDGIGIKLNDNSQAILTLVNLQDPQRVGEVKTQNNVHWGTELTQMPYQTSDGKTYGIAQAYTTGKDRHGNLVPGAVAQDVTAVSGGHNTRHGRKATRTFRYTNRRIQDFAPLETKNNKGSVQQEDIDKSQILARARYAALDQDTKNRLALAGLVNVLGVNSQTFNSQLAKLTTTGQMQTINRLSNSKTLRFQGQVDLGQVDANLGPVDIVTDQNNIEQLGVPNSKYPSKYNNDFHGGKIKLDLSSAFVGTGDEMIYHNPVENPHVMDGIQADNRIVNAYQTARKNYLSRLTGADQSQIDRDFGNEQKRFKKLLANQGRGLKPLDTQTQADILQAFSTGLLNSKIIVNDGENEPESRTGQRDVLGVDDSNFAEQRARLADRIEDSVTRDRALQSFDNLIKMFDAKFGTGLVQSSGGLDRNGVDGLTLGDFENKLKEQIGTRPKDEQNQITEQFENQKDTIINTLKDQFGDSYDQDVVDGLSLNQINQLAHTTMDEGSERRERFDNAYKRLLDQPVNKQVFSVADVINYAQEGQQDHQYPFMMAQALNKSRFRDLMMGDNTTASLMIMERSVSYNPDTAKTAAELLEEDKHGHEAELQQYLQDVRSGKKKFSWDPKENPEPGAFKADGSGLINPMSENQFKANALKLVENRLKHRGADPKHIEVKIDDQGIIHYKARIPLYNAVTHEVVKDGTDYKRKEDGSLDTTPVGTVRLANNGDDQTEHYQPIEGSIGQVFAPSHDGLIRTHYARFGGIDPNEGQKTFLPNSRAWYVFPETNADGSFNLADVDKKLHNGLGVNNYLRVQNYNMLFERELSQSVDAQLSTRNVGDVTNYNDTTILGKLLHGETLGNEAPKTILNQAPSATRQAILETDLNGIRFNDDVSEATATSNVVNFMNSYQGVSRKMRKDAQAEIIDAVKQFNQMRGLLNANQFDNDQQKRYAQAMYQQAYDVIAYHSGVLDDRIKSRIAKQQKLTPEQAAKLKIPSVYGDHKNVIKPRLAMNRRTGMLRLSGFENDNYPDAIQVQNTMQDPLSYNGMHSIGEFAHMENIGYMSDIITGQGAAFGRKRYLTEGVKVESNGRVKPNILRVHPVDKNGNVDQSRWVYAQMDGKWITADGGTPLGNLPFFEYAYKSAVDRISVGMEQATKGHEMTTAKVANMALGSWTTEDAMVVSKDFAKKHQFMQDDGLVRFVKIGDKISDQAGNKATIAYVVDPDMDPKEAQQEHISDVVSLFHDNPDLEVVMNGMSQLSRNNAATTFMMLNDESSAPMKFKRRIYDENGKLVDNSEVQTNATINNGRLIVTDQTVDHKVTLYDQPGDKGRKSGALGAVSDASKGAPLAASYFRRSTKGLLDFRRHLLSQGLDLDGKGRFMPINFDELAAKEDAKSFEYQINDQNTKTLQSVMTNYKGVDRVLVKKPDGTFALNTWIKNMGTNVAARQKMRFDGIPDTGELKLTKNSAELIDTMTRSLQSRIKISRDNDITTNKGYSASQDFLSQLPTDGGILNLPQGVKLDFHNGQVPSDKLYILPLSQRRDTERMDGMTMASKFNSYYGMLGEKLAMYKAIRQETIDYGMSKGNSRVQALIDQQIADSLDIQHVADLITTEAQNQAFGGSDPKHSEFNESVMAGHVKDSVTSQVSANPNLPLDTVEVSPKIAKKLGFVTSKGDEFAHMKGHPDWDLIHFHRDPIWREQGALALRIKVNPEITDVRVSPIMFSLMDGDHDGDNVGLIAMKGDDVQKELHDRCTVGQWLLDNDGRSNFHKASNLLNINAELVDQARRNNMAYQLVGKDGKPFIASPFNHQIGKDGFPIPVGQDKNLQKAWVELMSHMRDDVLPDSVKGKEGKFDLQNAQKAVVNGKINDSKILNMMVNNAIKQNYEPGLMKDNVPKTESGQAAIRAVENIVQTSRGFLVKQATPTSDVKMSYPLGKSSLAGDGIDYTDRDSMIKSLNQYVIEGAKGKPSQYDANGRMIKQGSIDGLLEYMDKPTVKELRDAAKAQVNPDGTLNEKNVKKYRQMKAEVAATIIATQRATKEKSDSTSIPGEIQKSIKNVLMAYGKKGAEASNRIGQGPTQRLLGIKRDPVEATKVVEYLQTMVLNTLLSGKRPKATQVPTYSLVGDESKGRFGNDLLKTCTRVNVLRNHQFSFGNVYDSRVNVERLGHKDLDEVAQVLGMPDPHKMDQDRQADFYRDFKDVLTTATTPLIPEFANGKQILNHSNNPDADPLTPKEFVNAMDYVYNDKLGMGVDRSDFEMLAHALTKNGVIKSCRKAPLMGDGFDSGVNTELNGALQKYGIKALEPQLQARASANGQENENGDMVGTIMKGTNEVNMTVGSIFGKEGSSVRQLFFANASDEQMQQMMALNQKDQQPQVAVVEETAVDQKAKVQDAEMAEQQVFMLDQFHDAFQDDRTRLDNESVGSSEIDFDAVADPGAMDDFGDGNGNDNNITPDESYLAGKYQDEAEQYMQKNRQQKRNTMRRREDVQSKADDQPAPSQAAASQSQMTTKATANSTVSSKSTQPAASQTTKSTETPTPKTKPSEVKPKAMTKTEPADPKKALASSSAKIVPSSVSHSQAPKAQDLSKSIAMVKSEVDKGTYRQPFEIKLGGSQVVKAENINQAVVWRYYEKAMKVGAKFDENKVAQAIADNANNPKVLDKIRHQLSNDAKPVMNGKQFLTSSDTRKFKKEAFKKQAQESADMRKAFNIKDAANAKADDKNKNKSGGLQNGDDGMEM